MIATEPLPAAVWEQIGLPRGETFADHRHLRIYGQRTADDRFAFGGRGAPYHFGSRMRPDSTATSGSTRAARVARGALPGVADSRSATAGAAPLGVPRDWHASVGFDRGRGLAWAGGYVGDGLTTANLAGGTLADLITGPIPTSRTCRGWATAPRLGAGAAAVHGRERRTRPPELGRTAPRRGPGRPARSAKALARFIGYDSVVAEGVDELVLRHLRPAIDPDLRGPLLQLLLVRSS